MSATHDELAYAVATESVASMRSGAEPWSRLFSADCHVTSSRDWPVPDFVLYDEAKHLSIAAEFKPPGQSKREYLTGLGQALAYTRDFDYGLLVVPDFSDDGYRVGEHIKSVLDLNYFSGAPVGLVRYNPAAISRDEANSEIVHFFAERLEPPKARAAVGTSFYAKWREISAEEMACFLRKLYDEETSPSSAHGTVRDRAWEKVWAEIQAGRLHHWNDGIRHVANTPSSKTAWMKNWRNFMNHVGWMETDGRLTQAGLDALHTAHLYGHGSQMFMNAIARALLLDGKHLILMNAINDYQDMYLSEHGPWADEAQWLMGVEDYLEDKGLLKRNPAAYSTPSRTPIPRQGEHRFHGKANSDSTPRRTVS